MSNLMQDAFASVHADDSLKTSTKEFLHEYRERKSKPVIPRLWQLSAGICAVFLILIGAIGFHTVSNTPVSYISIDVNPSIELTLNRWDRVISAEACNEDGSAILCSLSVKGMAYNDAIDAIIGSEAMQPYLEKDNTLTFTVASDDEDQESEILLGIANCAGYRNHNAESFEADTSLLEEAHEHGLSLGKYCAFLELSKYTPDFTPEDCQEMTMAQIHSRIRECRDDEDESDCNGSSQTEHGGNHNNQSHGGQYDQSQEDPDDQGQNGGQWGNGDYNGNGNHNGSGDHNRNGNHNDHDD